MTSRSMEVAEHGHVQLDCQSFEGCKGILRQCFILWLRRSKELSLRKGRDGGCLFVAAALCFCYVLAPSVVLLMFLSFFFDVVDSRGSFVLGSSKCSREQSMTECPQRRQFRPRRSNFT